jgi:hypothetical protein
LVKTLGYFQLQKNITTKTFVRHDFELNGSINQTLAIKYCNNFIGRLLKLSELLGKFMTNSSWKNQYIANIFPVARQRIKLVQ